MERITVAELATECSVKNQVVLGELKRLGLYVSSPTATIDESFASTIRKKILAEREAAEVQAAEAEKKKEAKEAKEAKKAKKAQKAAKQDQKKAAPKKTTRTAKAKKVEEVEKREAAAPAPRKAAKPAAKSAPKSRKAKAAEPAAVEEALPKPSLRPRKGRKHYDRSTNELVDVAAAVPLPVDVPAEEAVPMVAEMPQGTQETAVPTTGLPEPVKVDPIAVPPPPAPSLLEVKSAGQILPSAEKAVAEERPARVAASAKPATKKIVVPKARTRVLMRTSTEKVVTPEVSNRLMRGLRDDAARARPGQPSRAIRKKKLPRAGSLPPKVADIPQPPLSPEDFKPLAISEGVTLKELAEKMDIKSKYIIQKLITKGIFAAINQTVDVEVAKEVCAEFGFNADVISFEQEVEARQEVVDDPGDHVSRSPVVTIMGHVDHGKTSLLDAIRESNVTAKEAGGITQHIGAYHVDVNDRSVVFLDTPGHEAFTLMRARGAQVTDIVVLVVAADDGVMPQTIEAIHHAKAANVPILVAINKIDRPDAQPDRVKQSLSDQGLVAEDWGGDVVMVPVSATARTNLELLLEMILLVADIKELKANPKRLASGVVLEAKVDTGRGRVATVLVQNGTLGVGNPFVAGAVHGRVRALIDDRGRGTTEAGPSTPVEIQGLQELPQAGDIFQVFGDAAKARQVAEYRQQRVREKSLRHSARLTLDALYEQLSEGKVKELPLIVRADVQGSVEVVADMLNKLSTEKVKVRILHSGAGTVTETDVLFATASNAIIIAFNVRPEPKVQDLADTEGVEIRPYTVVYNVSEDITNAMIGMLEHTSHEKYMGRAEVRDTFKVPKLGSIAGSYILDGIMRRHADIRLLRDNVVIHEGRIVSLRRFKDDVTEVKSGFECGIGFESFSDIKAGDIIEAYTIEKVKPTSL